MVGLRNWWSGDIVDFTYADNATGFQFNVVPNIVHFVKLGDEPLGFVEVVCMRAAALQQRPEALMIHCDNCESVKKAPYWDLVKDIPGLALRSIEQPKDIFGVKFGWIQHASDIVRIRVLMEYGGIYLDSDSYLVTSLDSYRRYEMSIGWHPGENVGIQVLVAHKNARYLRLWYNSYRAYRPDLWYWNGGELPTTMFLIPKPDLVHRVPRAFGVHNLANFLYGTCDNAWREYSAIHLLYRHRHYLVPSDTFGPLELNNVDRYNKTFGQMARLVLFGTTKMGKAVLRDNSELRNRHLEYGKGSCE